MENIKEINIKEIPNNWNFSVSGIATLNVALGSIAFIWMLSLIGIVLSGEITLSIIYSSLVLTSYIITIIRRRNAHKLSALGIVGLLIIATINKGNFDIGYGLWTLVIIMLLWAHERTYVK